MVRSVIAKVIEGWPIIRPSSHAPEVPWIVVFADNTLRGWCHATANAARANVVLTDGLDGEDMQGTPRRGLSFGMIAAITLVASATLASSFRSAQAQTGNALGSYLDVENGKIYYEECGTGDEALVLLHDGVVHSAVWDDVWPSLCKEFHTIRYDRRGYGRSPAATGWYAETDDLFALLRHLKVSRAMLVGSSHGGELSIEFTLEHPNLVEQLVLVGAVVHGYPFSDHFLIRGAATWAPVDQGNTAAAIARIANDKYLTAADHPAARQKIRDLLTLAPQDFTHDDMARAVPSSLPRLHEIHVPTLILTGDADIPDVQAHAGAIETAVPNSRRIVVSDVGHLMYLEKPEDFLTIVTEFLEANRFEERPAKVQ